MTNLLKMLCLLIFCWLVNMSTAFAAIRYVKPVSTGLGTGENWENASSDLQAMLNASDPGEEVWVSAGTYKPTEYPPDCTNCSSPRDYTFFVTDGVKLYGGFAGFETDIAQRNLTNNITTLSGNIGFLNSSMDNCYHVVLAAAPSIGGIGVTIDGFTITLGSGGGYSGSQIIVNGISINRGFGGGIDIVGGTNFITNNIIYKCEADSGGGIFHTNGISTFIANNTIIENAAQLGGGGLYLIYGNYTITNNNISDNWMYCCPAMSGHVGAGILVSQGNNIISDNIISHNQANYDSAGGGIFASGGTNFIFNNTITNNEANYDGSGGGIFTWQGNNTIMNNVIMGNEAEAIGGGITTHNGTNNLINNIIFNNSAYEGGGIRINGSTNFINNIVNYNSASQGGGLFISGSLNNIVNNSIVLNTASNEGGGIYTNNTGSNAISNNILWGNKKVAASNILGADYFHESGTVCNFNHNLFQLSANSYTTENTGNYDIGTESMGNLFAQNPMFVSLLTPIGLDGIYRTADDGLRLTADSPAINAGTVIGAPDTDILGIFRSDQPDLGAYERSTCNFALALYVDASITESGNGESWETAFSTLTEALNIAHSCPWIDTIMVAAGTYFPEKKPFYYDVQVNTTDVRDVTFHLSDGLVLLGGYPSGGGIRNATVHTTILSGDIGMEGNQVDNSYHVVFAQAPTTGGLGVVLDGFTISGGNANGTGSINLNGSTISRFLGGGIYLINGDNKVSGCTLTNNVSANNGGAIYTYSGNNTIDNNTLVGNAANVGGAIYAHSGVNLLQNNVVLNNVGSLGGGMYLFNGDNTVTNNVIGQNVADYGGGIYNAMGNNSYTNNTIANNTANNNGGGVYTYTGSTIFTNNIFSDNKSGVSNAIPGSDYYNFNGANTFIHNLLQLPDNNYTTVNIGNYDLGIEATGNLFAQDPMFVNIVDIDGYDNTLLTEDDGLRLVVGSPALNAGVTNINIPLTDIMGNTRDAQPDLGAYEGEMPVGIKLTSASYITHFTAHPNPAGEATTITFTTPTSDDIMLTLLDIHGYHITQLFAGTIQPGTNYIVALDVSRLPAGTYFALMHCANGSRQQIPIIVVR